MKLHKRKIKETIAALYSVAKKNNKNFVRFGGWGVYGVYMGRRGGEGRGWDGMLNVLTVFIMEKYSSRSSSFTSYNCFLINNITRVSIVHPAWPSRAQLRIPQSNRYISNLFRNIFEPYPFPVWNTVLLCHNCGLVWIILFYIVCWIIKYMDEKKGAMNGLVPATYFFCILFVIRILWEFVLISDILLFIIHFIIRCTV